MKNVGNAIIIGDSYSTFAGFVPEGYGVWYNTDTSVTRTDVYSQADTWWGRLFSSVEGKLIRNESWSGTTVCTTTRPNFGGTEFVTRLDRLVARGFFKENNIETVFVFGATNDSWIDSPIGETKYGDITEDDKKCVLPAFCYLIEVLKREAPRARIIAIVNTELKDEIRGGMKTACDYYGVEAVMLENISKQNGHPDMQGMREIEEQVKNRL